MKNMTMEAIQDRVMFIRMMSLSHPGLAQDEASDLQNDFLRQVIIDMPKSDLAIKARLILKIEAVIMPPVIVVN